MPFWLFSSSKKKSSNYEKELQQLSAKIKSLTNVQQKLKRRKHSLSLSFTLYSLIVYILYAIYTFIFLSSNYNSISILVAVPIGIFLFRKLIIIFFNRLITYNEDTLVDLTETQEKKLEELKESTNFYTTKALLERYKDKDLTASQSAAGSIPGNLSNSSNQLIPGEDYEPSWYDSILDTIVGPDETSPNSRYALICSQCHNHNGLAPPGQLPSEVIYICPYCGTHNGPDQDALTLPVSNSEAIVNNLEEPGALNIDNSEKKSEIEGVKKRKGNKSQNNKKENISDTVPNGAEKKTSKKIK